MPEWRAMDAADLPGVLAIAGVVHPDLPERIEVMAEKRALFPCGCFVLEGDAGLIGYAISHPWRAFSVPPLDSFLHALPALEETRYLHDIALLPQARAGGWGRQIVEAIIADARRRGARSVSLVSVYGSAPFWRRFGFADVATPALADALVPYGPDARFMVLAL